MFVGDVAIAVDYHINGIDLGVVHGGQVRVFSQNDGDRARVVDEKMPRPLARTERA